MKDDRLHLIHGLDIPQIWAIVERDLRPLKQAVEATLGELGSR